MHPIERKCVVVAGYLRKYVGTYRVKAEYDQSTNDFCRTPDGDLDPLFDDLYIPCAAKVQIKHAYDRNLQAYIPSIGRGRNILKSIYSDYISNKLPTRKHQNKNGETTEVIVYESVYEQLEQNGIVFGIDETSEEIIFLFKATNIENLAKYLKPSTYGASISPFSKKNLPKGSYQIPDKDLKEYKKIISVVPKEQILKLAHIGRDFDKVIKKKFGKNYDIKVEQKKLMLKNKEFYHKIGMWDEYLGYLQTKVKEIV